MIDPGAREPEHTHRRHSVMIVDEPARIRYSEHGRLTFQSPERQAESGAPRTSWMEPEGPHSVENIDTHPYHAFRIEVSQPDQRAVAAPIELAVTFSPRPRHRT